MSQTLKAEAKAWRECAEWIDEDLAAFRSVWHFPAMTRAMRRRGNDHIVGAGLSRVDAWALLQSARQLRNWRVILCLLMALECESEATP